MTLVWLNFALACGLALSPRIKWSRVFYVIALSNAGIIALYYAPDVFGYQYYFANILKVVPLIMLLVHFARSDYSPNWSYRAMCWVFILEIITGGWHILSNMQSPFYDELMVTASLMELTIITIGGLNVRLSALVGRAADPVSPPRCSLWARRDHAGRG